MNTKRNLRIGVVTTAMLAAITSGTNGQVIVPGRGGTVVQRPLVPQVGVVGTGAGFGYGGGYGPGYGGGYGPGYGGGYGQGYGGYGYGGGPGMGGYGYGGPGYGGYGGIGYGGGYVGESYYERRVVDVLTRTISAGGGGTDCPIYEMSGRSSIAGFLKSRKLEFKRNVSMKAGEKQATVDFVVGKDVVIEYWSLDVDEKKGAGKKAFFDAFREGGGKVYVIGPKDTKDPTTIKQDFERVVGEAGLLDQAGQAKKTATTRPADAQAQQGPNERAAPASADDRAAHVSGVARRAGCEAIAGEPAP